MKNQFKKSLSLFLAVIMMLSCWVWIAPQKAEAGAPDNYTVTVDYEIMACCTGNEAPDESLLEVKHIGNNGTATTSSTSSKEGGDLGDKEGVKGSLSLDVTGWPSEVYFRVENTSIGKYHVKLLAIKINGKSVLTGKWVMERTASKGANGVRATPNSAGTGGTIDAPGASEETPVWDWPKPKLDGISSTLSNGTQTLDKVNTENNVTSTITLSDFYDQYGVKWTASFTPTFSLRGDGVNITSDHASISGSGNSRTITIKPWFQTLYPDQKSAKLYVDWTAIDGKTGTETINIDFPTYGATFYANGDGVSDGKGHHGGANDEDPYRAQIGDDPNAVDADGIIEHTHDKMYIGSVIGDQPAYAYREGFVFMGYYSKDNADALGKDANFAGDKFEDDVTIVPHTKSSDEKDAYYGGKFIGDTKWFAAWQAAPLNVSFVTADNQLIATLTGRHNNYMTASNMYGSTLNSVVRAAYTGSAIEFDDATDAPIYKDGGTTYRFTGWKIIKSADDSVMYKDEDTVLTADVTFQAQYEVATAEKYSVYFEDGNNNKYEIVDKNGVTVGEDYYDYRASAILPSVEPTKTQDNVYNYEFIGWANDIGKDYYTVDENNLDEDGALVKYISKDEADFIVKADATYVPVFKRIYREYSVTYNYTTDGGISESVIIGGYHWNDTPTMPEIKENYTHQGYRNFIVGWKINNIGSIKQLDEIVINADSVDNNQNVSITASYGNRENAKYVINFYGVGADGETIVHLNPDNNIYEHGAVLKVPDVPQTIETEDSLYTSPKWNPKTTSMAQGDAEYYAEYTKKDYADLYFYNYDGTLIYKLDGKENDLFVNGKIPEYTGETPTREEDVIGTYEFKEWRDGSGALVKPGANTAKFAGDTYLYAQYKLKYTEYEVKFLDEDGTQISKKNYHYGDKIEIPENPTKESDVEYDYEFRAWSPEVSDVCYGEATYTATYRRTPIYYKVTWLKDDKTLLSESSYAYDKKIQQAVMDAPVSYPNAAEGNTWGFKHWVQCDANGNDILVNGKQVIFERGQKMGSEDLYFYPVFKEVPNVLTVKFYKEDGTTYVGQAEIPYGDDIAGYADAFEIKALKIADENYHYVIKNWVDIETEAPVTTITKDISVKATHIAEPHNKQIYEVIDEPTCNVPGYAHYKCSAIECSKIDYNVAIAPVVDEGLPTGQIYVGDTKWTYNDYIEGIDYSEIKYVGTNTTLVVSAQDTGTRSMPWNLEGNLSRGVGKIEYNVSLAAITNPATIDRWTEVYNYEAARQDALDYVLKRNNVTLLEYMGYNTGDTEAKMKKAELDREIDALLANHKANATGIVSNLDLEEGKTYVLYIKVTEREGSGEPNVSYFSSGTISYGAEAPVVSVAGEGYGSKFCEEATVTVTDDIAGVKAYIDGVEITLEADGTYVCDEKGLHTLDAIDVHGNKTTKIFEIKGGHTYRSYVVAETCEDDGSTYDICTDCGHKANVAVIPASGHNFKSFVEKAADCVNDGYRIYTCDNNCGTKIKVYPTSYAELAQVGITAETIGHLVANGEHTYAMVKDEDGEDTTEIAWIIDKAANCMVEGSKHADCIVCAREDARITEVIGKDTVNGHNFYREKITTPAECLTEGKKTKTCKYCGVEELVETIPALGHEAGEYKVITAATCGTEGSKILTCSRCEAEMGEAVAIPELGHAFEIDGNGVIEEDGKYYQGYVCKNDKNHTKREELPDYQPPVKATVTFKNGEETVVAIEKTAGETIITTDVAVPTKAKDATYTYTFSHWADAEGKEVKFPITVAENVTYVAVFAEKYINYTITYYKEDGTTAYKKTGYLHNGEAVDLVAGPSKAETNINKYVFSGWTPVSEEDNTVYTDKVTIDGANINLKPTYNEVAKKYVVTYAYSKSDIIETFETTAGAPAKACEYTADEITKDYDSKYHYTFSGWNKAGQLAYVESNIYTTPEFTAVEHDFETTTKDAACGVNKFITKVCKVCGYTYQEEKKGTALEHIWGGTPEYNEETGKTTITCQREGCDATQEDKRTFTVKFFLNEGDTSDIKTITYLTWGSLIDPLRLPADPMKEETSSSTYKFVGWALKGTTTVVDIKNVVIKADAEYYAIFEEIAREYTVTFAYDAHNVIKSFTVVAGASIVYDKDNEIFVITNGDTVENVACATPTKIYDNSYHYSFSEWSASTSNILKTTYVTAKFDREGHDNTPSITAATCTTGEGTVYTCACGYKSSPVTSSKPLGHDYKEVIGTRVEPKDGKDGSVTMKCNRVGCGHTYVEVLPWVESGTPDTPDTPVIPSAVGIRLTVKDQSNKAIEGAKVVLYKNSTWVAQDVTNANGIVAFNVAPGQYTVVVTGVTYGSDVQKDITVNNDGSVIGGDIKMQVTSCGCACHNTGFYGKLFRFFHKIIKMITGEFKCCKDPSYLYG